MTGHDELTDITKLAVAAWWQSHGGQTTSVDEAIAVLNALEPVIRADERQRTVEAIEKHFREYAPPYLFPSAKTDLLPGMETITVHEAIMDVWQHAEQQILDLIDGVVE